MMSETNTEDSNLEPKRRTMSLLIPASRGVQGPGEIQIWLGANAAISSSEISSFRLTTSCAPKLAKILGQIVSEGVVVIDQRSIGLNSLGDFGL